MKLNNLACSLLIALAGAANAGGPVLPDQWRLATDKETLQDYSQLHLGTLISGDFNGDGLVDGAIIAVTVDNQDQVLLAFIYDADLNEEWLVLDSMPFSGHISMGLAKIEAGKHKVLCSTHSECNSGYKKEIIIENDAINYFKPESANSIYILENGEFSRIWQSD